MFQPKQPSSPSLLGWVLGCHPLDGVVRVTGLMAILAMGCEASALVQLSLFCMVPPSLLGAQMVPLSLVLLGKAIQLGVKGSWRGA